MPVLMMPAEVTKRLRSVSNESSAPSSTAIDAKTFSKTSRVPSSCRMVAGRPSSERTVASLRTAWIT